MLRKTWLGDWVQGWNKELKKWHVPPGMDLTPFQRWKPTAVAPVPAQAAAPATVGPAARPQTTVNHDVYLRCPRSEKDDAKALGARLDGLKEAWRVPAGLPLEPFSRWLPGGCVAGAVGQLTPAQLQKATHREQPSRDGGFEAFMFDCTSGVLNRDYSGYCWDWLAGGPGGCLSDDYCPHKHRFPAWWTAQMKEYKKSQWGLSGVKDGHLALAEELLYDYAGWQAASADDALQACERGLRGGQAGQGHAGNEGKVNVHRHQGTGELASAASPELQGTSVTPSAISRAPPTATTRVRADEGHQGQGRSEHDKGGRGPESNGQRGDSENGAADTVGVSPSPYWWPSFRDRVLADIATNANPWPFLMMVGAKRLWHFPHDRLHPGILCIERRRRKDWPGHHGHKRPAAHGAEPDGRGATRARGSDR